MAKSRRSLLLMFHFSSNSRCRPGTSLTSASSINVSLFWAVGKRWTVWIKAPRHQNSLPVLGAHQDPGPIPQLRYRIFRKRASQNGHVFVTLFLCITGVADKALESSLLFWQGRSRRLWQNRQKKKLRCDAEQCGAFHGAPPSVLRKSPIYPATSMIALSHAHQITITR
jgi:hypothetical protein